jgi:TnpA family transposase
MLQILKVHKILLSAQYRKMTKNKKRITLISELELEELYSIPKFSEDNRIYYFDLNSAEKELLIKAGAYKTKIYLLLQLGYFKATNQFYDFKYEDSKEDIEYLTDIYFAGKAKKLRGKPSNETIKEQRDAILHLFDYKLWDKNYTQRIEAHIGELLKIIPKHHEAFRELLAYFRHNKITIPSYRIFQDMFTNAISVETKRLRQTVNKIPKDLKLKLDLLIKEKNSIEALETIKSDQKDFKFTALRTEVKKAEKIKDLHLLSLDIIPSLQISKSCISYYCELTAQLTSARIRKLLKWDQYLHVLCFVYYRYQQFMDNLIVSFQYHMADLLSETKAHLKIKKAEYGTAIVINFPKLSKLLRLIPSGEIQPDESFQNFLDIAYKILPQREYVKLADFIDNKAFNAEEVRWEFYKSKARFLAMYLRPIFMAVNFEYHDKNKILPNLINVLKDHFITKKTLSKLLIPLIEYNIPSNMSSYMINDKEQEFFDGEKLEFYIYRRMYYAIDHGTLFCNDSVSYKNLENDFVSEDLLKEVDKIAEKYGYTKIPVYCDSRLDDLCELLHKTWIETNENIEKSLNKNVVISKDKDNNETWHLTYDPLPKTDENSFLDKLEQVEIAQIIEYVADKTNFWKAFSHVKSLYAKQRMNREAVKAGILADALGFGVNGMSEICDIKYNLLESNHTNYIRIPTLIKANGFLANFIAKLPIFPVWNIEEDVFWGDIDGQKHVTRGSTIQSRFSQKYFGQAKGISFLSTIVNNYSVNVKVISSNDHESHSVFDLVRGNMTDIPINKITGDTHTVNQLNFIALDAINVEFVPAIKNIKGHAEKLYCTENISQYDGLIKPYGKVNLGLIRKHKNDILKVLLSLILQENTQCVIIKKLSSHKRYSRLKLAIWEYNKIFKSLHILNMINDISLRKSIKKSRNRTEAYHQQQKVISKVYDGMLKGKKTVENQLQAEAIRLVANCIIVYNTILLNDLYLKLVEKCGEKKAREMIKRTSPISWKHIILTGKYSFRIPGSKSFVEVHLKSMEDMLFNKS